MKKKKNKNETHTLLFKTFSFHFCKLIRSLESNMNQNELGNTNYLKND